MMADPFHFDPEALHPEGGGHIHFQQPNFALCQFLQFTAYPPRSARALKRGHLSDLQQLKFHLLIILQNYSPLFADFVSVSTCTGIFFHAIY